MFNLPYVKPFTIHTAQRLHNKDFLAGKHTVAGPLRYGGG